MFSVLFFFSYFSVKEAQYLAKDPSNGYFQKSWQKCMYYSYPLWHSDLNVQNMFHSTIDALPGVPGVSKNPDNQTEVHSGELER